MRQWVVSGFFPSGRLEASVSSYSLSLGMATKRCYREAWCAQFPAGNFPIPGALWGLLSQALQLHHGLVLGFEPFQSQSVCMTQL